MARVKSGLYYPNKFARTYLMAMADVMGADNLKAALDLAGLSQYADTLPPDNLERAFDFADFTALNVALEQVYGQRGGRGIALLAGRACFSLGLRNFGALAGLGAPAFRALPPSLRVEIGLKTLAEVFTRFSDQVTRVEVCEDHYECAVNPSPVCWGRRAEKPACHALAGIFQEGMRWISGGREFRVVETACQAVDAEECVFTIDKQPIGGSW